MGIVDSTDSDDLSEEDLTDLDEELLHGSAGPSGGHAGTRSDLTREDLTDLDADHLVVDTDLRDQHSLPGLAAIATGHALPGVAALGVGGVGVDAARLVPSLGLDLLYLAAFVAFASGIAVHATRTLGARSLPALAAGAVVAGSGVYALVALVAAVAPGTSLAGAGTGVLATPYPQTAATIATVSATGAVLLVARVFSEYIGRA